MKENQEQSQASSAPSHKGPHSRNGKPFHGGTKTPLFQVWTSMRNRCENPHNQRYADYGLRGIKVCNEWEDFSKFREWSLENGYEKGLTIDRIDVNGDYSPENCRWATYYQQSRNTTRNRFITYNGKTQCVQDWAVELKINPTTIFGRLNAGKTVEEVLSTKNIRKPFTL